ncbi:hypothetical protein [Acetobacter senegalensis]|uniref:hypothetical protein n=1 Tax=Acetobacter senegalensis TaxID=446692 RepID=UPI00073E8ADB|nr:hypothetical protein [Acetobacter senegalensis]
MGLSSGSGRAPRGLSGGGQRQTKAGPEPRNARPERSGGWQGDGYFASRCKARHARRKITVSAIAGPVWLTPAPLPERPRTRPIRKQDSPALHRKEDGPHILFPARLSA